MKTVLCDGNVIYYNDFELIVKKWNNSFGGGYDRIYYNPSTKMYLVDSNRDGNDGLWDSLQDAVEYLFGDDADAEEVMKNYGV